MGIKMRLVLYATSGRDQSTVAEFVKDLQEHGGDSAAVNADAMDMHTAFVSGVEAHMPQTVISFDRFHVTKSVNDAVYQVRLENQISLAEELGSSFRRAARPVGIATAQAIENFQSPPC